MARQRVLVLVLLALVGGTLGGIVGWDASVPLYRYVRYLTVIPEVPTYKGRALAAVSHETYMRMQSQMLESAYVTKLAMNTPTWRRDGWGHSGQAALRQFRASRSVRHTPGGFILCMAFVASDPDVAVAGANALVEAFTIVRRELPKPDTPEAICNRAVRQLEERIKQTEDEIATVAEGYGSAAELCSQFTATATRLETIKRELGASSRHGAQAALLGQHLTAQADALQNRLDEMRPRVELLADLQRELATLWDKLGGIHSTRTAATMSGLRVAVQPAGPEPTEPYWDARLARTIDGAALAAIAAMCMGLWFMRRSAKERPDEHA